MHVSLSCRVSNIFISSFEHADREEISPQLLSKALLRYT
jgi:hypothetical protein